MRLLLGLIAALLLLASPAGAESLQGWHLAPAFPSQQHEHVDDTLMDGAVLTSPVNDAVKVLFHNLPSTDRMTFVRWGCESSVIQTIKTDVHGDGSPEQDAGTYNLTIDPAKCPGVGREIRVTANFETATGRKFTTTRTCVHTAASGSNYCGWASGQPTTAGRHGGGYWDVVNEYSICNIDGRDQWAVRHGGVVPGQTLRYKAQAGTLRVLLDPDIHHGSIGTVLATAPHGVWTKVTVPLGIAPGPHKISCLDERANHAAGVYVLPFSV